MSIAGVNRIPPNGYGCSAIRVGNAGGKGCGGLWGFEFGIGGIYGSATLIASEIKPCSCEP
jgi:hypothetical protein